mmetsp:Transcript_11377/g.32657  ORF Transcript_11377/g.32657 Transcript_11377/m.32657 type:complete len:233 (+) Transcript_11377:50-748(+)
MACVCCPPTWFSFFLWCGEINAFPRLNDTSRTNPSAAIDRLPPSRTPPHSHTQVKYKHVLKANQQRIGRPRQGPPGQLLGGPGRRRHVPLAGNNHGAGRFPVRRRCFLLGHPLPSRLPVQATESTLHNPHLPLQHQLQRRNLPRHPEGPMEPRSHHLESAVEYLFPPHGPQPRRPAGPRHRPAPQNRPDPTRQHGARMDLEVRHVVNACGKAENIVFAATEITAISLSLPFS